MLRAVSISGGGVAGNFSTLTVTGQGLFADGTPGAPGIAYINSPSTGFWNNSVSNQLAFVAQGIVPAAYTSTDWRFLNTLSVGWASATPNASVRDTSLQRDSAGLMGILNSIAMRGGAGFGMKALAGSYSVVQDDFTICCSTATTGFTILLPNPPAMNQYLNIKKVSADANRLIIDGNGNLIDALSTQSTILTTRPNFSLQFGSTVASPTGSAWQIL